MNNVIPIPPAYNKNETLDLKSVSKYVQYLKDHGATVLMTTAGTSQFNLLSHNEIRLLNNVVNEFPDKKILGIPGSSLLNAINFIADSDNYYFMALYPDRFYDYETIMSYLARIREHTSYPLYLHAMFMRHGRGGQWDYESEIVSRLFENDIICGIKEEHSNLQQSYNFVRNLPKELDVIVAGGSMRRHQFLKSAGANAFLAGVGNFFPEIEEHYCKGVSASRQIELESKLFDVFSRYGWHICLRIGLTCLGLYPEYDRMPWPKREEPIISEVKKVLLEIQNER